MTMMWRFPSLDCGDIEGVNDTGIQFFAGNYEQSITRECIQNSLDARYDKSKPVRVVFSRYKMSSICLPDRDTIQNVFQRAREYSKNQDRSEQFYRKAEECFNSSALYILKISDYNTFGLTGDDNDNNGRWSRLVRSTGSNSMSGDGGGSYGIGKAAPFFASNMRMVFYSTMTPDGHVAFQGKVRISSFTDYNDEIKRGTGLYGIYTEEYNKKTLTAIRDREMIPDGFERTEIGTDINIIGYKGTEDNWADGIIKAVLENFWMAIHDGTLEVAILNDNSSAIEINRDSLDGFMNDYCNDPDDRESTIMYYNAVMEPTRVFTDNLPILGDIELYIKLCEGGKRNVLGMRKNLMKIDYFTRLKVLPDDYMGVVIVRGDTGNKYLRMLEPPAHDKWNIDLSKENPESGDAYIALRKWIVTCLKTLSEERESEIDEIPDLGRYLPEDLSEDESFLPAQSGSADLSDGNDNRETGIQHGVSGEFTNITPSVNSRSITVLRPGIAGGEQKKRGTSTGKGRRKNIKKGVNGGEQGNTKYADVRDMDVSVYECMIDGKRTYDVSITPKKDDSGTTAIVVGYGDRGISFPMAIERVFDCAGMNLSVKGSEISGFTFKAGVEIKFKLELKSQRRYVIGVE